jgi:DNA-binding GntR family transcriptional regulator
MSAGKFAALSLARIAPRAVEDEISRAPLRQRIKDALLRRLLLGRYAAGERLIEMRLAAEFGTSQAPVREALRDLEATGLVSSSPRRGTYVSRSPAEAFREIYAVRGALEEAASRIAARRLRGDVAALEEALDGMRAAAQDGDVGRLSDHSYAFHERIMTAAGNQLLLNLWRSLQIETRTTLALLARGVDLAVVAESHQPIIDALAAGDAEAAARLAREHQDWFEAELPLPEGEA